MYHFLCLFSKIVKYFSWVFLSACCRWPAAPHAVCVQLCILLSSLRVSCVISKDCNLSAEITESLFRIPVRDYLKKKTPVKHCEVLIALKSPYARFQIKDNIEQKANLPSPVVLTLCDGQKMV